MGIFRGNPVLEREVGIRLRLSRYSKANRIAIFCTLFGLLPLIYLLTLRMLFFQASNGNNTGRDFYLAWMMLISETTALLLPAALTASTITAEREKQTWNALLLSRLSDSQIVLGKLVGALVPAAILYVLFLPVCMLSAYVADVSVLRFIGAQFVVIVSGLLSASLGLFCTWAFRRTQVALVTTVLSLLLVTVGSPLLYVLFEMANPNSSQHSETFVPFWFNPYTTLYWLLDRNNFSTSYSAWFGPAITSFFFGALSVIGGILLIVTVRLKQGPEELTH